MDVVHAHKVHPQRALQHIGDAALQRVAVAVAVAMAMAVPARVLQLLLQLLVLLLELLLRRQREPQRGSGRRLGGVRAGVMRGARAVVSRMAVVRRGRCVAGAGTGTNSNGHQRGRHHQRIQPAQRRTPLHNTGYVSTGGDRKISRRTLCVMTCCPWASWL